MGEWRGYGEGGDQVMVTILKRHIAKGIKTALNVKKSGMELREGKDSEYEWERKETSGWGRKPKGWK